MVHWISVSEMMPNENTTCVIGFIADNGIGAAELAMYRGGKWLYADGKECTRKVIYWAFLADFPKEAR